MLNRVLISFAVLAMTFALGCGGGSKKDDTTPGNGGGDNGGDTNPCGNGGEDTNPCGNGGGDTMAAGDAAKGATIFEDSCSSCHGDEGEGAGKNPQVKGEGSLGKFGSDKELWDYVKKEMPKDDPGSLSDGQVADVIAWMKS